MLLKIERDRERSSQNPPDKEVNVVKGRDKTYSIADMMYLFEGNGQSPMKTSESGLVTANSFATEKVLHQSQSRQSEEKDNDDFVNHSSTTNRQSAPSLHTNLNSQHEQKNSEKGDQKNNIKHPATTMRITEQTSTGMTPPALHTNLNRAELKAEQSSFFSDNSALVKGSEHALELASSGGAQKPIRIGEEGLCSRVDCFKIISDHFCGFVIVAFGSNRFVSMDFSADVQSHLVSYLSQQGILVAVNEVLDLKLNEVSFEEWSVKEAAFLRKSIHKENEIAMAFFPYSETESPLELSAEDDMYKLDLAEIRENHLLEFDLYLYFPVNRKYIRYAAKGRNFQSRQRSKLVAGGVKQIHIRKDSERDVTRYRVQNFLNDIIKNFSEKKTA